jgi:hypothetical protein
MKGTLPSEIGKLTKLRDLYERTWWDEWLISHLHARNLANNQFTKQLPSELTLGRLEFLKSLYGD